MKSLISQIVVGVIVTVIATVIANAIMKDHGRRSGPGFHFSRSAHAR